MSEISFDVRVTTQYLENHSDAANHYYTFAYNIVITNNGKQPAKLLSRHWIITDADGDIEEVKGAGVVGEQPHLKPGESFEYTSNAILKTPVGSMQGNYEMVDDEGHHFHTAIPVFRLATPNIVN